MNPRPYAFGAPAAATADLRLATGAVGWLSLRNEKGGVMWAAPCGMPTWKGCTGGKDPPQGLRSGLRTSQKPGDDASRRREHLITSKAARKSKENQVLATEFGQEEVIFHDLVETVLVEWDLNVPKFFKKEKKRNQRDRQTICKTSIYCPDCFLLEPIRRQSSAWNGRPSGA